MPSSFFTRAWGHGAAEQGRAAGTEHAAERARLTVDQLQSRLDRALITMEALWTLVCDRLGLTDQQLVDQVVEIDISDGIVDGKVRRPPVDCPHCGKKISRRFPRCLYCGEDVPLDPFG